MKRHYLGTILTCLVILLGYYGFFALENRGEETGIIKVGFIYENDESTPYTYNFDLACDALEKEYPGRVEILTKNNVPDSEMDEPLHELIWRGCRIIFTNSYSEQFLEIAEKYPETDFCQVRYFDPTGKTLPPNYHTFRGNIEDARYVSGIIAGMKLRELLDAGTISPEEALAGYVCAFPTDEVIDGYSAFLLGIRSVAPETKMKVIYTRTWSSFSIEKQYTKRLIDEGCLVISQHTDTIAPAMTCEEASVNGKTVYFVGYNQSMMDFAPNTALVSVRMNWMPYVRDAVGAVLEKKDIEKNINATVRGNDARAGFEKDWVQLVELNTTLAAPGTQEKANEAIRALKKGTLSVTGSDTLSEFIEIIH